MIDRGRKISTHDSDPEKDNWAFVIDCDVINICVTKP